MIEPTQLHDNYGREFHYLRLSLTDVCNFKCGYCLPNGYQKHQQNFLSVAEFKKICTAFVELGVKKIRLTGGEATLRKDFLIIAQTLSQLEPQPFLALTTNGYKLLERVTDYAHHGIQQLTVSIDSLIPEKFARIAAQASLPNLLAGIELALAQQLFQKIKINVVLLKDINIDEIENFIAWIKTRKISVRFIELMQTGENFDYFKQHHYSADPLRKKLESTGWSILPRALTAGPAVEYHHPDYQGNVGIIAPYSKGFCASCNRLRVSAKGDLHLCLFGDLGYPLRAYLQEDVPMATLKEKILASLPFKRESHYLHQQDPGINPYLASIGG